MPDPVISSFKKAAELLQDVLLREVRDRAESEGEIVGTLKPDPGNELATIDGQAKVLTRAEPKSAVLDVIEKVVKGIQDGTDLNPELRGEITRLINNQEERAELLNNLTLTHDYSQMVEALKTDAVLKSLLHACARRGDLTPPEALAFYQLNRADLNSLSARVQGGANSVNDVMSLLNKVDYTVQVGHKELERKFKNTTPQGREIIRRLAHKLIKISGSGAKKTTVKDD